MAEDRDSYDAIVIGSGQAAAPLCHAFAAKSKRVALIERTHIGGTCVNEGCSPTKTMVASARVAWLARRGADYGVMAGPPEVDMKKVRARKQAIVDRFRKGSEDRLRATPNIDVLLGEASFADSQSVEVRLNGGGRRRLTAPLIFLNTGCRPAPPDFPGADSVPVLDSTTIMELDVVPDHLLVIGGGYIGLEFGQMFRRFGSRVTVIQNGKQLLAREDEDVALGVTEILREDGVDIRLDTRPIGVGRGQDGRIRLQITGPGGNETLVGSHILVAAGRVPNTDRLNLEAAGVKTDSRGFIPVNERLETGLPGIYALGDVHGGPAFTHMAYDDYRIVRDNLLEGKSRSTAGRLVPYTVFIDPQLGRIGLSETEARSRGQDYRVARMPMSRVARALEVDESRGFLKVLVDPTTQLILGCAILGLEGGEIMSALQIAMMDAYPVTMLKDAVFAHPTLMESLNNLFGTLDG